MSLIWFCVLCTWVKCYNMIKELCLHIFILSVPAAPAFNNTSRIFIFNYLCELIESCFHLLSKISRKVESYQLGLHNLYSVGS
jgi:hypothetical protein